MSHNENREMTATIVVFSDSHLARIPADTEHGPDRRLEQAIELARPYQPDLVLLTGDIADDASSEAYERTKTMVSELGSPIIAIPGNHDRADTVSDAFGRTRETNVANWRIVTLDTTIAGREHGRVDVHAAMTALGPDTGQPTVLAMHHPPITTSTHPWFQLDGATQFVAALSQRSDVRCVITGHLHQAFHVNLGAITYIGCSSTWYSIRHYGEIYELDDGHVGALVLHLHHDDTFDWHRLPDPKNP
ncbi:MAG: metallophosphoesterase family protein [Ilumatobacteraceae bacterium]